LEVQIVLPIRFIFKNIGTEGGEKEAALASLIFFQNGPSLSITA
jgi:hypothetical protein